MLEDLLVDEFPELVRSKSAELEPASIHHKLARRTEAAVMIVVEEVEVEMDASGSPLNNFYQRLYAS